MISFLREWTMSLAGIIVFGSLCEMLLPNNAYKKYVNLAVGLMLCVALVSPFVRGSYDTDVPSFSYSADNMEFENKDTLSVFRKKLCRNIEEFVMAETDLKASAKCQVSDNEENLGKIENIYLVVEDVEDKRIDDIIDKISYAYGVSRENISVDKGTLYGD